MFLIMTKITKLHDIENQLKNDVFKEKNFLYSITFKNKEKTKGYFNWTPKEFPHSTRNVVEFVRDGNYFLLETSATSNLNEFRKIIQKQFPKSNVELVRPKVTEEDIRKKADTTVLFTEEHEKSWYIKAMLKYENKVINVNYSPITGKYQTSIVFEKELQEKMHTLFFKLLKDNEQVFSL